MPHCMVPGCANGSRKTKGIPVSYHRLPKDEKMRKIWLNKIRRDNPPQAKSCYVCSMHLARKMFRKLFNGILWNEGENKPKNRKCAIDISISRTKK